MKLGVQLGLDPGHIVLDGDPLPLSERPNGWMNETGAWHGDRPQLKRLCVRWGPRPLPQKGAEPPSQFSAHIVAKRLDASRWHLVWM